jgi:uncharacterized protein with von Willebrand factor type A (vWA) domain
MRKTNLTKLGLILAGLLLLSGCDASQDQNNSATTQPAIAVTTAPASDLVLAQADADNQAQAVLDQAQDAVASANSTARNFYVVFDGSGSMSGRAPGGDKFRNKLAGAKWAMHQFVEALPDDVNLGLYVFDAKHNGEVLPLAANNKAEFLKLVDAVDDGGGTPLGDSIEKAVNTLKKQYEKQFGYGEFRLVVVTDGDSSDSLTTGVKAAQKNNFAIYTVGFGIGERHELRKYSRFYKDAVNADELKAALTEAGSELELYDPDSFPGEAGGK